MVRLFLIISLGFIAANCGQKGPLEPPTAKAPHEVSQAANDRDSFS